MTLQSLNGVLVAPVFFFFALIMFLVAALCILAMFSSSAGFLVIGCISFVIGYNAWVFGLKMKNTP